MNAPGLTFDCRLRYPSGFTLDAAFNAPPGVTAIFGPSGSGKSTTLELIAGTLTADRGHITLGGRVLADTESRLSLPPEKRRVGVVFQDALLFPHMTVRKNLRYGMTGVGTLDCVADELGLSDLLDRSPATLSGGQRRRVAIGRALLRSPDILLLDEPMAGLEEELAGRVAHRLLAFVRERSIPMIYISHDQASVRRMADRVVVLEGGRIADAGPTGETLDRYTTLGANTHAGPVNLLRIESVRVIGVHAEGVVGVHRFYLPASAVSGGDAAYAQFAATDVALARGELGAVSIRNRLRGVVKEVVTSDTGDRVFVAVDVGATIWAEVTRSAVAELGLKEGVEVVCLIKAKAVRVVG